MNYRKYICKYKKVIRENKNKDIIYFEGDNNVLISVPHGVPQVRLGVLKYSERSTVPFAIELHNRTKAHLIIKNKCKNDDANFDKDNEYKDEIMKNICNYKYIIDIHGLSDKREMDINLGTNIGFNVERNPVIFDMLVSKLKDNNFVCSIDQPFKGGGNTIAGTFSKYVWTLQIEINKRITSDESDIDRLELLLNVLQEWIQSIKENSISNIE